MAKLNDLERQALELINRARTLYNERFQLTLPTLETPPQNDRELHLALDCLAVRKGTPELVFDSSMWKFAEACAEAWGTKAYSGGYAYLESSDGQNFLVRSAVALLPEGILKYADALGLGNEEI